MSDSSTPCPHCGAPLPPGVPPDQCPRCLLAQAMQPTQDGEPAPSSAPLSPAELAPHFPQLEILECLGRGGMGVVYKVRQKSLNRLAALKLLAPERAGDPQFAARFEKEAHALAALSHPHIVAVYDFGEAGGFYFLLMEFVDGVNLRQAMSAGRFTPDQALAVVPPVCDALQFAHDHGIVHRDIKPENLLLDRDGRVKIADFGIAKMLGADTATGLAETQPVGTPQYMAPEQRAHHRTDHRADIYSLGVVLYELLTGELPAGKLQPPSRKVQIDVRLDEVVLRALSETPELRYQTAAEFRTQVEAAAQPGPPPKTDPRDLTAQVDAHFTALEQRDATQFSLLFAIWNSVTWFAPLFAVMFLPKPLAWFVAPVILAVGLAFFPLFRRNGIDLRARSQWARQHGITREQIAAAVAIKAPPLWKTILLAMAAALFVALVGLAIPFLMRVSKNEPLMKARAGVSSVEQSARAWQLWNSGRPAEALPLFRELVKEEPSNANVWNGLGWSAFNSGLVDEAHAAFEKTIALDPKHLAALNGLGQIALAHRDYTAAEAPLRQAAELGAPAAWFGLARLYLLQGKYSDAEKWAQRVVDSGQGDDVAAKMLAAAKARSLTEGLRAVLEPPLVGSRASAR